MRRITVALAAMLALTAACGAQQPTKRTERVPMRDGVRLATDLWLPAASGRYPVVFMRTPYSKAGIDGADFVRRGYVLVAQDTRGRFESEGLNLPFESDGWWEGRQDGYDTLEWISRQPWCSGRIGTLGGSAGGIAQILMAATGTQRISAQFIQVAAPGLYEFGGFPGGVFKRALIEDWLTATKYAPEAADIWRSHDAYDAYWQSRDAARRFHQMNAPAIHMGGWYDIFCQGAIETFLGKQLRGAPGARGRQKLVMGPNSHGGLADRAGDLRFPGADRAPNRVGDSWAWFDHYLKGEANGVDAAPAATWYTMGDATDPNAPGSEWHTGDAWPPPSTPTPLYLAADGALAWRRPSNPVRAAYTYDPNNPAPTVGGTHLTLPAGPREQSAVEARPDVLVYTTPPLTTPLEITGRVRARLHAACTTPDTDYFIRLCDVYPNGRSYNLVEGQIRARFRRSLSRPALLKPGEVAQYDIDLWSTSIVVNRGHRLRVHVTSSSAPAFDPNPNTGDPLRRNRTTRPTRVTILAGGSRASCLILPVVGAAPVAAR